MSSIVPILSSHLPTILMYPPPYPQIYLLESRLFVCVCVWPTNTRRSHLQDGRFGAVYWIVVSLAEDTQ